MFNPRRACPWCKGTMYYVREVFDEAPVTFYGRGYWECFDCGNCMTEEEMERRDEENYEVDFSQA